MNPFREALAYVGEVRARHRQVSFLVIASFVAASIALAPGCKSPEFADSAAPKFAESNSRTNAIQQGDLIAITFQYSTNFNATQKVPLDGLLNLEAVGLVKAAGQTPQQLQAELAQMYRPQTKDDIITVKLLAAASGVYVSGAVFHPGRVAMDRPLTVFEAVMEAGGFDPNRARLSAVTVLRIDGGRQIIFHLDLKSILKGREQTPFYLQPFDIVHVPTKTFNF